MSGVTIDLAAAHLVAHIGWFADIVLGRGPITTGKLVAWGRRPWLGPRFANLVRNP